MRILGYFKEFFRQNLPQQSIRQQIFATMKKSLTKSFQSQYMQTYIETLSPKSLLSKSVEMFVGSTFNPRNQELAFKLLDVADRKATTQSEKLQAKYYRHYFHRMEAFKNGNQELFHQSTEKINQLAATYSHPQSCYLVGKQMFQISSISQNENQRNQIEKTAINYFQNSITQDQFGGFYYIAEILQKFDNKSFDQKQLFEFYLYGAAFGDPMSYFKLANIYLKRENVKLYIKYLKMAAENGVIEAQHSLGCEYKSGEHIKKDQLKAFAWFTNAAAHGFVYSKFNIVEIFLKGSSCGKVKRNPSAVLIKLQQIKKSNPQFAEKVDELMASQQIQEIISSLNQAQSNSVEE